MTNDQINQYGPGGTDYGQNLDAYNKFSQERVALRPQGWHPGMPDPAQDRNVASASYNPAAEAGGPSGEDAAWRHGGNHMTPQPQMEQNQDMQIGNKMARYDPNEVMGQSTNPQGMQQAQQGWGNFQGGMGQQVDGNDMGMSMGSRMAPQGQQGMAEGGVNPSLQAYGRNVQQREGMASQGPQGMGQAGGMGGMMGSQQGPAGQPQYQGGPNFQGGTPRGGQGDLAQGGINMGQGGGIQSGMQGGNYYNDQARQAYHDQATRQLDPQWKQNESNMEAKLTNMGLSRGSAAWDREAQNMSRSRNDAYDMAGRQAILTGGQEGQRMQGMDIGAGNFNNQAQQQGWNQRYGQAQLNQGRYGMDQQNNTQRYGMDLNYDNAQTGYALQGRQIGNQEQAQDWRIAQEMQRFPYELQNLAIGGYTPSSPTFSSYSPQSQGGAGSQSDYAAQINSGNSRSNAAINSMGGDILNLGQRYFQGGGGGYGGGGIGSYDANGIWQG